MERLLLTLSIFAFVLLIAPSDSLAAEIRNPQNIDYMKAEVTQSGSVTLAGDVSELNVSIYIPQSDFSQATEVKEVSNADYSFETDKFGNKKINMFWKNPSGSVDFKIKTIVAINRRSSGNSYAIGDFLKPTELIQSMDPEIKSLAENLTAGKKTDFDKIASLTKWVNENIEYDLAYSDVNLSATTVLHLGKGVCDEFSTLLLSMARSLGYKSSYAVGYAYGKGYTFSEGDFAAHGWTEIYTPSGTIVSDPTWGEIPVDATHIRFASLADSIYPEVNVSGSGRSPSIKIGPTKTEINVLEARENPIIRSESSLLETEVWKGYAVAKTELSGRGCVLTKISAQPCSFKGIPLLQPEQNDSIVYFCGNKTVFSLLKLPDNLDADKIYTCPISVYPYNGNPAMLNLTIAEKPSGSARLSLDKAVAEPGERVAAESRGSHLFTSDGQSGFDEATFIANEDMVVYGYKDGSIDRQEVTTINERPFDIVIQANETQAMNETGFASITVRNLLQKQQVVTLDFRGKKESITIGPDSEKTLNLSFVPASREDSLLQVYASSDNFSTYASKLIEVQEPKIKGWLEGILGFLSSIIGLANSFLRKVFGVI